MDTRCPEIQNDQQCILAWSHTGAHQAAPVPVSPQTQPVQPTPVQARTLRLRTAAIVAVVAFLLGGVIGVSGGARVEEPGAAAAASPTLSPTTAPGNTPTAKPDQTPQPTVKPTAPPTQTPEPTPESTSGPHKVGERIGYTSGGDPSNAFYLTIKAVTPFSQKYNDPEPGMKYITTDVLLEGTSGDSEVTPFDFAITDDAGYVYEHVGMYKEPSLPYEIALTKGKKVRGWMTWQIPKTMKKGSIVFADSTIAFTIK